MTAVLPDIDGAQLALDWEQPTWRAKAEDALERLATSGRSFTAFDVAAIAGEPDSPNAWGGLLSRARRQGLIVPVGFTTGDRPTVRGSAVRVWRGAGDARPT